MKMILFAGLGNPDKQYLLNRHNAGFLVVDAIRDNLDSLATESKKSNCLVSYYNFEDYKIIFAKPQKYVNCSGGPLLGLKSFFKIATENMYIFHDELDISSMEIRYKTGGGNAGHNGLRSIDSTIGSNYRRVRIGVGRPERKEMVSGYVLSDFTELEIDKINKLGSDISKNLKFFLEKQF